MSNTAQTPPNGSQGTWLKSQMERRTISVRRLADAMGVTTKTVYDWRDDRTAVSETRIPQLAEQLGVSEIEARRGLGYWVPDEGAAPAEGGNAQLRAELKQMEQELAEMQDRIRRLIEGS